MFAASGSVEVLNLLGFLFFRPGLNSVYSEHSFAIYPLATAAAGGEHRVRQDYSTDTRTISTRSRR